MTSDAERIATLRLARSEGIGPSTFASLIERYSTAQRALDALPDLARSGGLRKPLRARPESCDSRGGV